MPRLQQGMSRPRPKKGHAQAHTGIQPLSQLSHRTERFQPLPSPLGDPPYHFLLEDAVPGINAKAARQGKIVFHTCGDTGGIKNPDFQINVADAMKADLGGGADDPVFFFHLGDVVYYNGEVQDYYGQFYEPYDHYTAPILAIPGNHDGDPVDSSQASLDGFVRYFMSPTPVVQPESNDAPRVTVSQPNVYFALDAPFVRVVGMYSNVPEYGSIDSVQQQWLTNELATAPDDKALIVAVHHPVYSFDDYHSGSPRMADAIQHAINDSRRVPNMVLNAHVHNYQRVEKAVAEGLTVPFLVIGNGGYYHLHSIHSAVGTTDPNNGATLVFEDHKKHGYVTLTVDASTVSGTLTLIDPRTGEVARDADTFSYPGTRLTLPENVVVSL